MLVLQRRTYVVRIEVKLTFVKKKTFFLGDILSTCTRPRCRYSKQVNQIVNVEVVPGDLPRSVNHKIDGIGHKIPDADKKSKQARHKPHAEHVKIHFFTTHGCVVLFHTCPTIEDRRGETPRILPGSDKAI